MAKARSFSDMSRYADRAKFYDIEYHETRDHGFLLSRIRNSAEAIMVVPGGTGSTAIALSNAYKKLTIYSIDIERQMVEVAEKRFSFLKNCCIYSLQGDMTDLNFSFSVDRIFVAREAFQMLPNDRTALACLCSLRRQLSTDGEIVLDLANFDHSDNSSDLTYFDARREDGIPYLDCQSTFAGRILVRYVTQYINQNGDRKFRFDYTITSEGELGVERFCAFLKLRRYSRSKVERLIASAGLSISGIYGDYDLSPVTRYSPRLCFTLG